MLFNNNSVALGSGLNVFNCGWMSLRLLKKQLKHSIAVVGQREDREQNQKSASASGYAYVKSTEGRSQQDNSASDARVSKVGVTAGSSEGSKVGSKKDNSRKKKANRSIKKQKKRPSRDNIIAKNLSYLKCM